MGRRRGEMPEINPMDERCGCWAERGKTWGYQGMGVYELNFM